MALPMQLSDMIVVGEVTSTHGVRGDVKIRSFTENPKQLKKYHHLYDENIKEITITFKRDIDKGMFIGSIGTTCNKEDAALLKGTLLYIHKSERPEVEDNECYLSDIINCKVIMEDMEIGKITAFHDFGAGTFLDINLKNEKKTGTLPFNKDAVLDINLEKQEVIISKDHLLV